jgi:hypothetical protein
MSTRTNIIIQEDGDTKVILYHHCDGYIEGVGIDLIRYLIELTKYNCTGVINYKELLALLPEEYEETKGIHGDIEYLYTIRFTDTSIKMWVAKVNQALRESNRVVDSLEDERKLYSHKYRTGKNFDSAKLYLTESELTEAVNIRDRSKSGWISDKEDLENLVKLTMAPTVLENIIAELKEKNK